MLLFWVYRARREGEPIPRWHLHSAQWVCGDFSLGEQRDPVLARTVLVARLLSPLNKDLLPPLIDAKCIHARGWRMVWSGVERNELTRSDRAQTWVLHTRDRQGRLAEQARSDISPCTDPSIVNSSGGVDSKKSLDTINRPGRR